MKNPYRASVIRENLDALKKDEYAIARLHGATDNINIINIDEPELKLLLAYYEGKEIEIKESGMKRMTRNEYNEYVKELAGKVWTDKNYTMDDYNRDCDAVEIIPLDLSKYPQLSEKSVKWINKLFTEEDTDRNGNYMLRGFTYRGYAEIKALDCTVGDYVNGYSLWGYNSDEFFIYTYCEGDTTLTIFPDKESFEKEYNDTLQWYKENYG